ncbi:MAG: GldG family protein [Myxococcota bacterium]
MALNEDKAGRDTTREGRLSAVPWSATIGLVLGVLGTTALVFGIVLVVIEPRLGPLSAGNVAFGLVGLVVYVATNRAAIGRAVRGRSSPLLALEVVIFVGVLGLVVATNYGVVQWEQEWDLTRDRLYTLQPQSQQVAERLDRPVFVYGFLKSENQQRGILGEQIRLYRQFTDQLQLEFIDPDRVPAPLIERFELDAKSARIVLATESRHVKIERPTEDGLTNALIDLLDRPVRHVVFVEGHGEPSAEDKKTEAAMGQAAAALRADGYEVENSRLDALPEDAELLVLVAPRIELLPSEAEALDRFLEAGGHGLILLDPGSPISNLGPLFEELGVNVGDDLVVDQSPVGQSLGFGPDAPLIRSYEAHPITRPIQGQPTLFLRVRSVQPALGALNTTTLLRTSEESWAEADPLASPPWRLDGPDAPGPIAIAVAIGRGTAGAVDARADESRVVVFGDADFASNRLIGVGANRDLLVNTANWLLNEVDRVTVRPRQRSGDRLAITAMQHYGIMFFAVNLLPLLIVGFGFSVWALRRRR